jgi:hypothetical protein
MLSMSWAINIVQMELKSLLCRLSQDLLNGGVYPQDPSGLFRIYEARRPEEPVESMAWLKMELDARVTIARTLPFA